MTAFTLRMALMLGGACLLAAPALAHPKEGPATSAGPGRIICKSAAACELSLGTAVKLKYQINATALPDADKERLTKQCTAQQKAPCIATVDGNEMGDAVKIKAKKITWHN